MFRRLFLLLLTGTILLSLFVLFSFKLFVILECGYLTVIILLYFIAIKEYNHMVSINNEFEEEMNKEGKKVIQLNAEDSWNFLTKGIAFIDNKPIFFKESHLWQSKKK